MGQLYFYLISGFSSLRGTDGQSITTTHADLPSFLSEVGNSKNTSTSGFCFIGGKAAPLALASSLCGMVVEFTMAARWCCWCYKAKVSKVTYKL